MVSITNRLMELQWALQLVLYWPIYFYHIMKRSGYKLVLPRLNQYYIGDMSMIFSYSSNQKMTLINLIIIWTPKDNIPNKGHFSIAFSVQGQYWQITSFWLSLSIYVFSVISKYPTIPYPYISTSQSLWTSWIVSTYWPKSYYEI